jgi:hypothetical protein
MSNLSQKDSFGMKPLYFCMIERPNSTVDKNILSTCQFLRVYWSPFYVEFTYDTDQNVVYPQYGHPSVFGNDKKIKITPYHIFDFLVLLDSACPDLLVIQYLKLDTSLWNNFTAIKIVWMPDFEHILDTLEKREVIEVRPSNNIMAIIPKKFRIIIPSEEKEEYDFDCLGTSLCKNITNEILKLWRITRVKAIDSHQ